MFSIFSLIRAKSRKRYLSLIGVILMVIAIGIALPWSISGRTTVRSQARYTRFWPSFTEVYSIQDIDPSSGLVTNSQTHRLSVVDDFTWHDEVTSDALRPKVVGDYYDLRAGVLHHYIAQLSESDDDKLGPNQTVALRPELDTSLFFKLVRGLQPGWQDALVKTAVSAPVSNRAVGRIAKVRREVCPALNCPPGTEGKVKEKRIEYDAGSIHSNADSVNGIPFGGIPLYSDDSIDGKVVNRFMAESLQIGPVTMPALASSNPSRPALTPVTIVVTLTPVPSQRPTATPTP
ncbi:MAG: hypothetical protein ACR2HB_06495 [Dehalococcoidia bacterium]